MPKADTYIIDTCSLTKMRHEYPQKVFPSVWRFMGELADARTVQSIELVYDELKVQSDDDVAVWAKEHLGMFLPLDGPIQKFAKTILKEFPDKFVDLKKRKSGADPFVVACAKENGCHVVTEEKKSGGPGKVKIPDVCAHFKVKCMRLVELLERAGFKL